MIKILGVVGSPRKNGNTHVLVSGILDGAKTVGAFTDILFLGDKNIKECNGCHVCWQGKQCSKNDDMNGLYPKIIDSDIIIFGTPVYWYGPTALMKGFIDRFVYFNSPENRKEISGKSAVLVIPYEEDNPETAVPLVTFFEKSLSYLEMNIHGKIIVPGVTEKGEIKEKPIILQEAFELGKKLGYSV
ncbi:MAG: flavodoxin family protein [Candidatus Latescibacteria bacterium]|nr:flavodoxin family protein [Candidatus Latescibacterota bacterium]